ncbi:MAG: C69 family dipeptidase [Myxococcota bacterium]
MCDSLLARGEQTTDGATLFAKNSDRQGNEAQPFVQFPAAFHPRGSRVRCTHIEIDQVGETYRIMGHSPGWSWGFEQGVNEYGVAIGNHATWSRDPLESEPGLVGMDLVRLGLERGRDAREALEIIASLVETHGQGGSAFAPANDQGYQNSFSIADGNSAWILETTARGWAARAVTGAGMTNALSLGGDWQIGSRDLERHAVAQGYCERSERLDFKQAYAIPTWPEFLTERRREAASACLAEAPLNIARLKSWLRDHGVQSLPPSADREASDPDRYSVCMHADDLSMTTASLIVRLPEDLDMRPWPVWISFATPCTGVFVPTYLEGVIPPALARADEANGPSVWLTMRRLQAKASLDFACHLPTLQKGWAGFERERELARVRVEEEAAAHYARDESEQGDALLTAFMSETVDRLLETASELTEEISA